MRASDLKPTSANTRPRNSPAPVTQNHLSRCLKLNSADRRFDPPRSPTLLATANSPCRKAPRSYTRTGGDQVEFITRDYCQAIGKYPDEVMSRGAINAVLESAPHTSLTYGDFVARSDLK